MSGPESVEELFVNTWCIFLHSIRLFQEGSVHTCIFNHLHWEFCLCGSSASPCGVTSLSSPPCLSWVHRLLVCDCLVCSQAGAHMLTSHPPSSSMWCCQWSRKICSWWGGHSCTRKNILHKCLTTGWCFWWQKRVEWSVFSFLVFGTDSGFYVALIWDTQKTVMHKSCLCFWYNLSHICGMSALRYTLMRSEIAQDQSESLQKTAGNFLSTQCCLFYGHVSHISYTGQNLGPHRFQGREKTAEQSLWHLGISSWELSQLHLL